MLFPCSAWVRTVDAGREASCATCRRRLATASAWTDHGMALLSRLAAARHCDSPARNRPQLALVVGVRPKRTDGVDGVGLGGGLVLAVTQDASKPQRHAARVAAAGLDAGERDLCPELGAHMHDAVRPGRSRVGAGGQPAPPLG